MGRQASRVILDAVREERRHPVPSRESERAQRVRHAIRLRTEGAIAPLAAIGENQREAIGFAACDVPEAERLRGRPGFAAAHGRGLRGGRLGHTLEE